MNNLLKPKQDFQVNKFYTFERSFYKDVVIPITLSQAKNLIKKVASYYGISYIPKVVFINKALACSKEGYSAFFDAKENIIKFGREGSDYLSVYHETAHFISDVLFGCLCSSHGKEFVTIHSSIMSREKGIPLKKIYKALDKDGIKYFKS